MTSKLKELILHLASESRDDRRFGATKLNKVLFIIDFYAYGLWNRSITDAKYVHRQFGPVPFDLLKVRNELEQEGRARVEKREYLGKTQTYIEPLENPDLSLFTRDELELVNVVLKEFEDFNAAILSDWTHSLRPWLDTEDGEEIPYNSVFVLKDVPVNKSDLAWGQQRLAELRNAGMEV